MQCKNCVLSLACAVALAAPFTAAANTRNLSATTTSPTSGSISGSGGTLTGPKQVGQNISVQGVTISSLGETANFTCTISFFGAGTYQWNWTCSGGTITITNASGSTVMTGRFASATMTLTGAGGGRGGRVLYTYRFSGTFSGSQRQGSSNQSITGSIATAASTPYANGAPGKVGTFTLNWNATTAMVSPLKSPRQPQSFDSVLAVNRGVPRREQQGLTVVNRRDPDIPS